LQPCLNGRKETLSAKQPGLPSSSLRLLHSPQNFYASLFLLPFKILTMTETCPKFSRAATMSTLLTETATAFTAYLALNTIQTFRFFVCNFFLPLPSLPGFAAKGKSRPKSQRRGLRCCSISFFGRAPIRLFTNSPFLKKSIVGIL